MLFGTKRARGKLSNRLAAVYAVLFTAVLLLLSIVVFAIAWHFLINRQIENLHATVELIGDHVLEEIAENEPLSDPGVLEEQNTNYNLSIFLIDQEGNTINRVLNFPTDAATAAKAPPVPRLHIDDGGQMLLIVSEDIEEDETYYCKLCIVQNLASERTFLMLLAILLLGANFIGAFAALLVGRATSRRMLSPIDRMITAANHIGSTSMEERLEVPEPDDELKSLALTINGMLERVSAAYSQQGRFVADVSHELRTPLAVMQGNVDLLARWGSQDPQVLKESISALQRQTDYMGKLVENLLFLARCDNDRLALNQTSFPVKALFDELLEEQALIDTAHRYRLDASDSACMLTGDRAMMKQLLRALIDNSVKYTQPGGEITLACKSGGETVSLTVSDNGAGMDAGHLEHIFERFYRIDKARARATGGMGLGLSIAQAIAEAHGGSVRAESEVGHGTAVTVTLPSQS